jgi:hypothetical protein
MASLKNNDLIFPNGDEVVKAFNSHNSGGDCNNWTSPGLYQGSDVTNAPNNSGWVSILTLPCGDFNKNYVTQIAIMLFSTNLYVRQCNNGTWGAWKILTPA